MEAVAVVSCPAATKVIIWSTRLSLLKPPDSSATEMMSMSASFSVLRSFSLLSSISWRHVFRINLAASMMSSLRLIGILRMSQIGKNNPRKPSICACRLGLKTFRYVKLSSVFGFWIELKSCPMPATPMVSRVAQPSHSPTSMTEEELDFSPSETGAVSWTELAIAWTSSRAFDQKMGYRSLICRWAKAGIRFFRCV